MTATIKLMVQSGSGVLSAVASRLQTTGVRVKSHTLEPLSDTSAMLVLTADAADRIDETAVRSALDGVEVVKSVEDISADSGPPKKQSPEVEVPSELVDRIVASFPKIMPHIQSYEETVARDGRKADKLRQLGVETARRIVDGNEHQEAESLPQLIDDVVIPAIGRIAEARRDGDKVVVPVSLFTRRVVTSMDLVSGDGERCDFMCGLLEGLAAAMPGFDSTSVDETQCRANGDSACVFTFS